MRRFLMVLGAGGVAIAVVSLLTVPVESQGQRPAAPEPGAAAALPAKPAARLWTPSRTPWGDPDLQGIWNFATSTPLERPAELGEKAVLSEAEAEEFEETRAFNLTRDRRDGGVLRRKGEDVNGNRQSCSNPRGVLSIALAGRECIRSRPRVFLIGISACKLSERPIRHASQRWWVLSPY